MTHHRSLAVCSLLVVSFLLLSGIGRSQDARVFEPGVNLAIYAIGAPLTLVPELIEGQTPNTNRLISSIDLLDTRGDFADHEDQFLTVITGRLQVEVSGEFGFRLTSDDGSNFWLDDRLVIDHDGLHGATVKSNVLELESGYHTFTVRHFENGGGAILKLEWKPPGVDEFEIIPRKHLSTPAGVVRVTSPGNKKIEPLRSPDPPGDGRPLVHVHPSYDVMTCRPDDFQPKVGGLDFLSDGRMIVSCWNATGEVYVLDGVHGTNREEITAKRFAWGLAEPLGLSVVGDRIFVLQKQELTELIDHDGNGEADEYRCISDSWSVSPNFHEFSFGLVHLDGWLYFNLAIAIDPGGKSTRPQAPDRGRSARVELATGKLEFVAEGLRTPNGIGLTRNGQIFIADNQGDWLPASKIVHLQIGAFYDSRAALPKNWQEKERTPPVAWLPQNEIGNSPGEISVFPHGPFMGQLAVSDVTHGGIKRVFMENVRGRLQGAAFRFTQGLEAGINRMKIREDGTIFVGGIGSGGNWRHDGKNLYGLQRLSENGEPSFEMRAVRAKTNGMEIEFTEPLAPSHGERVEDYTISMWRYVPTSEYGGPKVDERQLVPKSASVSADRRKVFLELDHLLPDHVIYLRLSGQLRSVSHRALWSTECWYTLNGIPKHRPGVVGRPSPVVRNNVLSDEEKAAGWELLFDGKAITRWRGFRSDSLPRRGWVVEDGCLMHVRGQGGGDLVTTEAYDDFEFECEWMVEPGGNSGIMYNVSETRGATYETGPEMQVLDDALHGDGKNPLTSAGSLYALISCRRPVSRPAGEFNHARIRVEGNHVEHWLNGYKVVEYRLDSPRFTKLVAGSKFSRMPEFGKMASGLIAIQDHGDEVRFRNLKIRRLVAR